LSLLGDMVAALRRTHQGLVVAWDTGCYILDALMLTAPLGFGLSREIFFITDNRLALKAR
jgi:hypothetical protein